MTYFRTHWLPSRFGGRSLGRPGGWRSVLTWWLLILPKFHTTLGWGFCHVFINARMKASSRLLFTFHWCPVTVSLADAVECESMKTINYTGLECSSANWMQEKEHQGGWKSIREDGHLPSHPDPVSGVVPILWDPVQPSINDILKVLYTFKW